ncbi:NAD(P)/FAD-dependent oxidoreductase [Patescibacteria group bacterium]
MYDLIIIGGGPAAISAGIYSARKKIKTLMVVKEWGGQAVKTGQIENYPGFDLISGMELVDKLVNHLKKYNIEIIEYTKVDKIEWIDDSNIKVSADNEVYQSKAIIFAAGGIPRKLKIPGEEEFSGKGVAYCSICDAPLFKNKEVAVVGGGNAGLETALDLVKYASKIHILEFKQKLGGDKILQDKIKKENKISVITSASIQEIKGDKFVNSLIYNGKTEKNKVLSVQGVFVSIGWIANSSLLKDVVELNEWKEIKINSCNVASKPNIFAAGDATNISHKQLIIASGEGAKAALNAYEYLNKI